MTTLAAVAGVAAVVAVAGGVVTVVVWWRVVGRLASVLRRLEPDDRPEPHRLGPALDRLDEVAAAATVDAGRRRDHEARLRAALDAVDVGVVVADRDGVVVHRNISAAREDELGHTGALVRSAEEEVLAATGRGVTLERELSLFGPPRRTLVVRGVPLRGRDGPYGSLVLIDDVSERVRVDAIRRDFVANISHELKTPIGAIGVLTETLLDERDDAVRHRLLERTNTEALRVARIIDELLDLSAIEADEDPSRVPLPTYELIAAAVDRVKPSATLRGTKLVTVAEDRPRMVQGDRRQLVRALVNLLENAVKYSDDGAEVRIGVDATVPGHVDLVVEDDGVGIPGRDHERIFERFYRVDSARSRASGGTGLGLSIVSHVAQNHGGTVLVESHEGEGSTFVLRIPVADPDEADPDGTEAAG